MKTIKRISSVLKTTGVVLIMLAVVLAFYALTVGGSNRNMLLNGVRSVAGSTNFVDRIAADNAVFNAMAQAVSDRKLDESTRAANINPIFDRFREKAENAEAERRASGKAESIAYFENGFDYEAFAERMSQMEGLEDARIISEVFEYLDSLTAPAGKPGKALPNIKAASSKEWFDGYYVTFSAEHGEEAGTYVEFIQTVQAVLKNAIAGGTKVTAAKDYVSGVMTYEEYLAVLPEIRSIEATEDSGNFLDSFAVLAEKKLAGEKADFEAFFSSEYALLSERYPDKKMPSMSGYLKTMQKLLESESYDGTPILTINEMVKTQEAEKAAGYDVKLADYCVMIVRSADDQAPVPAFGILWRLTANYLLICVIGIALVILAKVITVLLSKRLLAKRENAGIKEDSDILLRVEHLKQYFKSGDYVNHAVDDVSFFIKKGEVFGLVGESGCGKTTTGRTIINLYDPTDGDVYFQGLRISSNQNGLPVMIQELKNNFKRETAALKETLEENKKREPAREAEFTRAYNEAVKQKREDLKKRIEKARDNALESSVEKSKCIEMYREKRKAELTAAFEKESSELTGEALAECRKRYEIEMAVAAKDNIMTRMQMIFQDPIASINPRMTVREIIAEGLVIRGITDKKYIDNKVKEMLELVGLVPEHADRYPHEFSGGQRQRIGIARAIVMEPDLIIADEPISALDVSIQAQVINLLNDLRNRMGLTILFIAHNLSVVKYFSDRIAVMYFGRIMELTTSKELFDHPLHPYTKSLLSAIPYPDPHYEKQRVRVEYNPAKAHSYTPDDQPSLREITPGHYIHCNNAEFEQYKKELGL